MDSLIDMCCAYVCLIIPSLALLTCKTQGRSLLHKRDAEPLLIRQDIRYEHAPNHSKFNWRK